MLERTVSVATIVRPASLGAGGARRQESGQSQGMVEVRIKGPVALASDREKAAPPEMASAMWQWLTGVLPLLGDARHLTEFSAGQRHTEALAQIQDVQDIWC